MLPVTPEILEGVSDVPASKADDTASPLAVWLRQIPFTRWVNLLVVAGGAWFVLWVVNPDGVLFSRTTPTGGDLGAHVWGPAFLRDELLPNLRLSGWTPDWYAGFPAYHFYMVIPMLAIVAVDVGLATPLLVVVLPAIASAGVLLVRRRPNNHRWWLLVLALFAVMVTPVHYGMSIKWITVVGLVVMPVAGWALGHLAGLPFPGPALTSAATLPFVFDRSFNIMGGNLMSTMAGEFAYALAVSACLVYLGLLVRGLETGRGRVPAALLLALTGLCHLLVAFFALVASVVALAIRPGREALRWLVTTGVVAGLCSAFWVLPFWWQRDHLNDMAWHKLTAFRSYLWDRSDLAADFLTNDPPLQPVIVLAGIGLIFSVAFRRRLGFVLAGSALFMGLAFVHLPEGRLYNGRILPAYYLCLYLLAGMALADGLRLMGRLIDGCRRSGTNRPGRFVSGGGAAVVFLTLILLVGMPLRVLPGGTTEGNAYRWMGLETTELNLGRSWVRWNFEGYENRVGDASGGGWEEKRALVAEMTALAGVDSDPDHHRDGSGCGRLMWEYGSELVRYGTPMALMLLPHWTDGCIGSMEGLYFEASTTTPYHFLVQSELSVSPSRAQRGLPYRGFDLDAGIDHLRQLGVRWYSAFSDQAVREARAHPDLVEVASSGPWTIFEVQGMALVSALEVEPAVFEDVDHEDWLNPSVEVFQRGSSAVPRTIGGPASWQRVASDEDPERRVLPVAVVTDVVEGVDRIRFRVDRVGVPVLVRSSYFPNWKVSGADGPWRATPNLMVVVPTAEEVELFYGRTAVDLFSVLLTLSGIGAVVVMVRRPRRTVDEESLAGWYDVAAIGPDGDRRLDRWVERRSVESDPPGVTDGPAGSEPNPLVAEDVSR